jgi:hypothetical protein
MKWQATLSCGVFFAVAGRAASIEARLLTPISSYSTKSGTPITALVTTRVCSEDVSILPEGTLVRGAVRKVHRVGLGLIHETAGLQLEFRELHLPDGRDFPIGARLAGIENARERVDGRGRVHGIRATAMLSNRFGERLVFAVSAHPAAMIPLFVLETGFFHFPEPEIQYGRGAELDLDVEFPDGFGAAAPCAAAMPDASPDDLAELRRVVDDLPYWTYSKHQRQPLDIVNLLFIGCEESVERAFAAVGWSGARANSMRAGVAAVRAIAEDNSYSDAPMRTLLLDGAEPDIRLQKSLNTFEKRDHLRIWKRPDSIGGRAVWASAATRDLAATFSMRPFGFTHEIQNDVDLERDRVVRDLVSTGCVDSVAYARRQAGVRAPGQEYRKSVRTDERVAVVMLNACAVPRPQPEAGPPMPRPAAAVRAIRRVTLTARNHFLRDNIVWRSGDAIRLSIQAMRGWEAQRKDERRAASYYAQETWPAPHAGLRR